MKMENEQNEQEEEYLEVRPRERRQERSEDFDILRPSGICEPSMNFGFGY
jgi:hypothetical protein